MHFYLPLPTVKTAGLYLISIKSYSKNTHGHLSLKWTLVMETRTRKDVGTLPSGHDTHLDLSISSIKYKKTSSSPYLFILGPVGPASVFRVTKR